jgi:hypothetical protein
VVARSRRLTSVVTEGRTGWHGVQRHHSSRDAGQLCRSFPTAGRVQQVLPDAPAWLRYWAPMAGAVWSGDPGMWRGGDPGNPLWGDGWGWSLFRSDGPDKQVAVDYRKDWLGCHLPAKAADWIYVQGYPVLAPQ